jgi:hypothetical protein
MTSQQGHDIIQRRQQSSPSKLTWLEAKLRAPCKWLIIRAGEEGWGSQRRSAPLYCCGSSKRGWVGSWVLTVQAVHHLVVLLPQPSTSTMQAGATCSAAGPAADYVLYFGSSVIVDVSVAASSPPCLAPGTYTSSPVAHPPSICVCSWQNSIL